MILIIQGVYIEKGSKSFEVTKNLGLEKGLVEECLVDELRKAGFKEIVSTIVDEAVWAESPYDRVPVTGDIQKFCIIQAKEINYHGLCKGSNLPSELTKISFL